VLRRGRRAVAFTRQPVLFILSYYYTAAEKLGIAVKDRRLTGSRRALRAYKFHTVNIRRFGRNDRSLGAFARIAGLDRCAEGCTRRLAGYERDIPHCYFIAVKLRFFAKDDAVCRRVDPADIKRLTG